MLRRAEPSVQVVGREWRVPDAILTANFFLTAANVVFRLEIDFEIPNPMTEDGLRRLQRSFGQPGKQFERFVRRRLADTRNANYFGVHEIRLFCFSTIGSSIDHDRIGLADVA